LFLASELVSLANSSCQWNRHRTAFGEAHRRLPCCQIHPSAATQSYLASPKAARAFLTTATSGLASDRECAFAPLLLFGRVSVTTNRPQPGDDSTARPTTSHSSRSGYTVASRTPIRNGPSAGSMPARASSHDSATVRGSRAL
jgi:hypothetical protein